MDVLLAGPACDLHFDTNRGNQIIMTKTKINARHIPYGWHRSTVTNKPVRDKAEQRIISKMVALRDDEHFPLSMIADSLNDEGVPTKRGKRWTYTSIKNALDRYDAIEADKVGEDIEGDYTTSTPEPEREPVVIPGLSTEEYLCGDGVSVVKIPVGSADELRRTGRVTFDGGYNVDSKTGKIRYGWGASYSEQDLMELEAVRQAEKRLTVAERVERVRFEDPVSTGSFGESLNFFNVDKVAADSAGEKLVELHGLLDQVTDQPRVKRELRRELTKIFRELAIDRQFRLHLLWRLNKIETQAE